MDENENFGTIVVDGKIINLDKISQTDLANVLNKLEVQIEKIEKNIMEQLDIDDGTINENL